MQAIETKYHGPTNSRGSSISARCERGKITIPYPHELSGDAIYRAAVDALIDKFTKEDAGKYGTPVDQNPWKREYVTGQLAGPNGSYVHVFTGK